MNLPLDGIRVLDLARARTGPFTTQILADFGAEVIKIEPPKQGEAGRHEPPIIDGTSAYFYSVNRNKKSFTINLKSESGKIIFKKLAAQSDVILDQFRPGVMERLGLGYDELKKDNNRLIYCALSGFGSTGPMKNWAGHDINLQSLSGLLGLTGTQNGRPAISQVPLAGFAGGTMFAVIAILLALASRERTGQGQFCDVSMLDSAVSYLTTGIAAWTGWGEELEMGNDTLTGKYAFYNIYETADNRFVSLGAIEKKFWVNFCEKIGVPEYIELQWDESKQEEIIARIQDIIKSKPLNYWVDLLQNEDSCFTPLLTLDEMFSHPQIKDREMVIEAPVKGPKSPLLLAGTPIKLSDTPAKINLTFSGIGEHNKEILLSLGYSEEEIKKFTEEEII